VYAYTDLLDRNFYAIAWEAIRCSFGIYTIYYLGDWFGLSKSFAMANQLLIAYFVFSFSITVWFALKHKKEDKLGKALAV
jgi:alkylglycerol monooxygenase